MGKLLSRIKCRKQDNRWSSAPRGCWIIRFSPLDNAEGLFAGQHSVKGLPVFYWCSPDWLSDELFHKLMAVVIQMFLEKDYARLTQLMLQPPLASVLIDQFNTFIDSTNEDSIELEEELLDSAHQSVQLHIENEQLLYLDLLVPSDFDPNYKLREILCQRKILGSTVEVHPPKEQNPLPDERSEDMLLLIPNVAESLVPSAPDGVSTCTGDTTEQENDNILNSVKNNLDKTDSKIELINCEPGDEASSRQARQSGKSSATTCASLSQVVDQPGHYQSTSTTCQSSEKSATQLTASQLPGIPQQTLENYPSTTTTCQSSERSATQLTAPQLPGIPQQTLENYPSTSTTCQSSEKSATQLTAPQLSGIPQQTLENYPSTSTTCQSLERSAIQLTALQLPGIPQQTLENLDEVLEAGKTLEINDTSNMFANKENEDDGEKTFGPKSGFHGDSNNDGGDSIDDVISNKEQASPEWLSTEPCTSPFLPIYGLSRNFRKNKMRSQKLTASVNESKTDEEKKEKSDTGNNNVMTLNCGFLPIHGLSLASFSPLHKSTQRKCSGSESKKRPRSNDDNVDFIPKRMRCKEDVLDAEGCSSSEQSCKKTGNQGCAEGSTENSAGLVNTREPVYQMQERPDSDDNDDDNSESLEWHDAVEDLG